MDQQHHSPTDQHLIPTFHAHVYYVLGETESTAQDLYSNIRSFGPKFATLGNFHKVPVGPHLQPMFTVEISYKQFVSVVSYLMLNHKNLSVLIHPETGDDLKDHSIHPLWLGDKLPLDFTKL